MPIPLILPLSADMALPPVRAELVAPHAARGWSHFEPDVLGTRMTMLVSASQEASANAAFAAARAEIDRLDAILSGWRLDSEFARFNRSSGGVVSPELYTVLAAAEAWREATRGAYDARIGTLIGLWRGSSAEPPSPPSIDEALRLSRQPVRFYAATRTVRKSRASRFDMDGLAKGYVIDAAARAACLAAPEIEGVAIEIGGEIRCWGHSPEGGPWTFDIADPLDLADNADTVASVKLSGGALATSGRGPRDLRVGSKVMSATIDPRTGWPVERSASVSVVADTAMEADALATAMLVMPPHEALAFADGYPRVAARCTMPDGSVLQSNRWREIATENALAPAPKPQSAAGSANRWPADWAVRIRFDAPDRQEDRPRDFRTPYLVMWITDTNNRPVRTIKLIGNDPDWHRDNYIWWASYREAAPRLVRLRSSATAESGLYNLFWRGFDDEFKPVPPGDYILHVETSQERGKHTHRTIPLRIGNREFTAELERTREAGGVRLDYGLSR